MRGKYLAVPAAVFLVFVIIGSANAVPVTQGYTITIDYADPWNIFGVSVGDVINGNLYYDDANIPDTGSWQIERFIQPNKVFYNPDEFQTYYQMGIGINGPLYFPDIYQGTGLGMPLAFDFQDGIVVGINMYSWKDTSGYSWAQISGTSFSAFAPYSPSAPPPFSSWHVSGTVAFPVPEPSMMFLFGAGLTGLVVARRRKK